MNLKLTLILFIVLSFILCIGAVSAENSTSVPDDNQVNVQSDNAAKTTQTIKNPKIDADVDADSIVVAHKKKSYFKVKVKDDDNNKPVKKFKLKVKVYTKSKSKSYIIKTNSKGIAKFNTKNLKTGNHKVVVTDADKVNKFKEVSHIFVGKKHKVTLKPGTYKKLKNRDVLRVYTKYDDDEKELKVAFKAKTKKSNVLKAIFYFKNTFTGKIIKKIDFTDFEHGKWDYPDQDYSKRYAPIKVKITYVTI